MVFHTCHNVNVSRSREFLALHTGLIPSISAYLCRRRRPRAAEPGEWRYYQRARSAKSRPSSAERFARLSVMPPRRSRRRQVWSNRT